jgi:uncharacterized protein (DUF608 family)
MFERPTVGRRFDGEYLTQIAMPMGGIGAGCVCLNGHGGLQDVSLRHKPVLSAMPDWTGSSKAFGVLRIIGERPATKLLEGPMPLGKIYDQGLQFAGRQKTATEGLPRWAQCSFAAAYPFGMIELSDPQMALSARITGWSPFIPLDDRNSGIPCAILEYEFTNPTPAAVEFEFSYHLENLAKGSDWKNTRNSVMGDRGVYFTNVEKPNSDAFGSASLSVEGHAPKIKAMWMRSAGFDISINTLWRELIHGTFQENAGNPDREFGGSNGGSILMRGRLEPGASISYPIVITWYFPNAHVSAGEATATQRPAAPQDDPPPRWRPYYAGQWKDAADVSAYVRTHFDSLRSRTLAFQRALSASDVPAEVVDAVSSNLAILKSPTVHRQENGNFWGWEGCAAAEGSCHGSCTHVWNYAQALPHLFPRLERTLREAELVRSMDETGHVQFRAALPDGPTNHNFHAAADGQLGGIMKLYRDWQITGDRAWMAQLYPLARRSLEFCIGKWDPDHRGALFEPHHNTYDIEFWGPDGMCTSIYLGALLAAALMADELGETDDAKRYRALADIGKRFADQALFNGEYYAQKVMWTGLHDESFVKQLSAADADSQYVGVLRKEGPSNQYGDGCLADGVIGAWMATIYGIGEVLAPDHVRSNLRAIFRHNFKSSLWDHASTQRAGYAMGREPGLLLCTWPRGGRPTVPFAYADEVWTGIEYQVASHLIEEGMTEEALTIVRGVRSRFDGKVRNPFNEYECGNYYARALASFAVLNSLSGFRYSAATRTLWLSPKIDKRPWQSFFSTATAFGTIRLDDSAMTVRILEGELPIESVVVNAGRGEQRRLSCAITATPEKPGVIALLPH